MKKTVKEWDLDRDVQFNTRVVGAYWQEDQGRWKIMVDHGGIIFEDFADIFISAQGFLK